MVAPTNRITISLLTAIIYTAREDCVKREEERADDRSRQHQERRVLLKDSDHFVELGILSNYWAQLADKILKYDDISRDVIHVEMTNRSAS